MSHLLTLTMMTPQARVLTQAQELASTPMLHLLQPHLSPPLQVH